MIDFRNEYRIISRCTHPLGKHLLWAQVKRCWWPFWCMVPNQTRLITESELIHLCKEHAGVKPVDTVFRELGKLP